MTQIATAFDGVGYVISGRNDKVVMTVDGVELSALNSFGVAREKAQKNVDARAKRNGLPPQRLTWETLF